MGREYRKSQNKSFARMTDLRKKANKDERREVKKYLSDGHYEGLQQKKKFFDSQIQWDD